jgi:hypothetical protein
VPLLARFNGVYLLDSTQLTLPAVLASLWASTGGALSPAGLKVMATLELLGGALSFQLGPGRQAEFGFDSARPALPKGALRLADLGFFDMDLLKGYQLAGVFWISRVPPQTLITLGDGRLSLWRHLSACREGRLQQRVEVGEGLSGRLLAWRCPQEVASRRLQKALANAQKKGKTLSEGQRVLCQWTVLLSNVPVDTLSAEEVWIVYRVRWQVELLFKRWKSLGGLAQSRGEKPYRVLTEVYAKLLGALVLNGVLVSAGPAGIRRSVWKAFQEVQSWGRVLLVALGKHALLMQVLALLAAVLRRVAEVNSRRGRPATFQTLEQPQHNGPEVQAGGPAQSPEVPCGP